MQLRKYISTLLLIIYTIAVGGSLLDAYVPCKCGHTYKCESEHIHLHNHNGDCCSHDHDCFEKVCLADYFTQINNSHCEHTHYIDTSLYTFNPQQNEIATSNKWFAIEKCLGFEFNITNVHDAKLNTFDYSYTPLLLEHIYKSTGFRAPPFLI
ncbi:MAG: hypothetical protein R3Y26_09540 [Rikenellaceae bacterium]